VANAFTIVIVAKMNDAAKTLLISWKH